MNDWQADTLPMTRDAEGNWQLTLYLEPGKWAYKFVQDGRWIADPAARAQSPDGSGGMNSLLQVGPIDQRYQPRANADERGTVQTLTVTSRRLGIQQLLHNIGQLGHALGRFDLGVAGRDDAPAAQDGGAVAERFDLVQLVRDVEDRAAFRRDLAQRRALQPDRLRHAARNAAADCTPLEEENN